MYWAIISFDHISPWPLSHAPPSPFPSHHVLGPGYNQMHLSATARLSVTKQRCVQRVHPSNPAISEHLQKSDAHIAPRRRPTAIGFWTQFTRIDDLISQLLAFGSKHHSLQALSRGCKHARAKLLPRRQTLWVCGDFLLPMLMGLLNMSMTHFPWYPWGIPPSRCHSTPPRQLQYHSVLDTMGGNRWKVYKPNPTSEYELPHNDATDQAAAVCSFHWPWRRLHHSTMRRLLWSSAMASVSSVTGGQVQVRSPGRFLLLLSSGLFLGPGRWLTGDVDESLSFPGFVSTLGRYGS